MVGWLHIHCRVHIVYVFLIQLFTQQLTCLAEPLEMDDLPLPQEFDDIIDIGIVAEPQNVVIGGPCFLLGSQVLGEVCHRVAFDGHRRGVPGESSGCSGVNAYCMIDEVRGKGAVLNLLIAEIPGQLMDDGPDHLQVSQFLCTQSGLTMELVAKPHRRLVGDAVKSV